jgi:putative endonuclease
MYYVYIIQSQMDGSYYVGSTNDLKRRLREHNNGGAKFTSAKKPYFLSWYCAFNLQNRAVQFEKYLKQGSGFAFARKRLV